MRLKEETKQIVFNPLTKEQIQFMFSKFQSRIFLMSVGIQELWFCQESIKILWPIEAGSKQIMPHLLTVAGEAASRSIGSKIRLILLLIEIISPELRHNFLLSSRTVFIFSIQIASTGPSRSSHLRVEDGVEANCLNFTASTPSNH